ncbi:MAG: cysteine desulfurase NifS [Candidatus Improbicoccus devescovinae]|nr:MAG: cysteine desulfurase NifS [Candidatus Improbicoccus devescovinae]
MQDVIYADYAATTPVYPEVIEAMAPFFNLNYGNASAVYSLGRDARKAMKTARESIAERLGAEPEEIFFTSGATESNNWAVIMGPKISNKNKIITSKIEHHAILQPVEYMKSKGFETVIIDVGPDGLVNMNKLENCIDSKTGLVSVMFVNNEIGTIQPIEEISKICQKNGVIFHTDAAQGLGHLNINVKKLGINMLSFSGHKFGAPKGIGGIFIKKGLNIGPFIHGGGQEFGMRPGTENIASIIGMAKALEITYNNLEEENEKLYNFDKILIESLLKIKKSRLNGHPEKRIAGNTNFCFEGVEGEAIILNLDQNGICVSSGSACTSRSLEPSHVLLAIGLSHEISHGSVRISLGRFSTKEHIDFIISKLTEIIIKLRKMSPLWNED